MALRKVVELAVCIVLLSACSAPPSDLVFVSYDTVRRDHLPVYGYARDTAPALAAGHVQIGHIVSDRSGAPGPAAASGAGSSGMATQRLPIAIITLRHQRICSSRGRLRQ